MVKKRSATLNASAVRCSVLQLQRRSMTVAYPRGNWFSFQRKHETNNNPLSSVTVMDRRNKGANHILILVEMRTFLAGIAMVWRMRSKKPGWMGALLAVMARSRPLGSVSIGIL